MMSTSTADLAFPMLRTQGCPFHSPPGYKPLVAEAPVTRAKMWDGLDVWLVTGYKEARAVLSDARFSGRNDLPSFPFTNSGIKGLRTGSRQYTNMDNPEHNRFRRMITELTGSGVAQMRPTVERIINERIDAMLASPTRTADLYAEFALAVPSLVICELLGVPHEDQDFFQEHSVVTMSPQATVEEAAKAADELLQYVLELIDRREREPAAGLISRMTHEHVLTGDITRLELAEIGRIQLIAGHDTTANMLALGALLLMLNPEQAAELRETDDPAVMDNAIEEMMRYLSIAHAGRPRVALEDVEIAGQLIAAGDGVVVAADANNHDESIFPDSETFDIHRDNAKRHLGFGFGTHRCHGELLAEAEMEISFNALLKRIPTLRLAVGVEELSFKRESTNYGVAELPVTW
jgi:cytochrome P450